MSGKDKNNTKWKKTRHDKFYKLAKEQGYRSRACFKLIALNKQFDFLSSCRAVVDLCAAPGGWLQVCQKFMPVGSLIIGIDILPIKAMRGVITMQQDITTQKCRQELKANLQGWNLDCVIHDGAPNLGGATWHADAFTQILLVVHSLRLATEFLRPGGWFVTKIFRSQDYNALIWALNHFFKKVTTTKPPASRNSSAEIFAVCQGFIAPKKFDKRLLDPEHLFSHIDVKKTLKDPFTSKKEKRNRSGYEDGITTFYKPLSVAEFVNHSQPLEVLATYSALKFDKESKLYAEHTATTEEIRALCEDLKVLGKGDLRVLLRWLKKLREYKKELEAVDMEDEEEDEESEEELTAEQIKERDDAKLSAQLEAMHEKMMANKTKAKRKRMEKKKKEAQRLALNALTPYDIAAEAADEGIFSLKDIKNEDHMESLRNQTEIIEIEPDSDDVFSESEEDGSDSDAMLRRMEENLDESYNTYKARIGMITKQKRKKLGLEEEEEEDLDDAEDLPPAEEVEESEDEDTNSNPLLVSFGNGPKKQSAAQITKQFFDRDMFAGLSDDDGEADMSETSDDDDDKDDEGNTEIDEDEEAEEQEDDADEDADGEDEDEDIQLALEDHRIGLTSAQLKKRLKRKRKRNKMRAKQRQQKGGNDDKRNSKKSKINVTSSVPSSGGAKPQTARTTGVNTVYLSAQSATENVFLTNVIVDNSKKQAISESRFDNPDGEFEEVPESDFSSFSDTDAEAETMAMGTLMIRHKTRNKLIDDSFNRYTWDDPDDLPSWFQDSEQMYNTRPLPITKGQVDSFKEKLRAINARPIKKIAEARARKKQKAVKRWEKIQQKANSIAKADGGSEADKLKTIQKLYKKQDKRAQKQDKIYMVSKKGGGQERRGAKGRGKIVNVDKRLKNDRKAERRAIKKKSGKHRKPQKRRKR